MTLLIGIICEDGVVIGADGARSGGAIRQPVRKLSVVDNCLAMGVTGAVGMGQMMVASIRNEFGRSDLDDFDTPEQAAADLGERMGNILVPALKRAGDLRAALGNGALEAVITYSLACYCVKGKPALALFDVAGSPTMAPRDVPYFIATGSGQSNADPFLAFLKKVFWPGRLPKLSEGVLATVWTLDHAIATSVGYVGDPIQVIEMSAADGCPRELAPAELDDHRLMYREAERVLSGFRETMQAAPAPTEPPIPEPGDGKTQPSSD